MNRLRTATVATLLTLTMSGAALHAADGTDSALKPEEASIPFLSQRAIISWQADGISGLWVQDRRRQWYYASLITPCQGLDFAITVGFQTRTSNTLDRFSAVVVPNTPGGIPCQLSSLTRSDPPPGKQSQRKGAVGPRAR